MVLWTSDKQGNCQSQIYIRAVDIYSPCLLNAGRSPCEFSSFDTCQSSSTWGAGTKPSRLHLYSSLIHVLCHCGSIDCGRANSTALAYPGIRRAEEEVLLAWPAERRLCTVSARNILGQQDGSNTPSSRTPHNFGLLIATFEETCLNST